MPRACVTIREARSEDMEDLTLLINVLFSIEADFHFDGEKARRGLALLLEDPRARVLVAEGDGRIRGMATGQLTISTAEGGPSLLVEDVVVHEEWRGRGLGHQLLESLAQWALARGASRLQLLADCNNIPALAFYRHLGWKSTALICLRKLLGD